VEDKNEEQLSRTFYNYVNETSSVCNFFQSHIPKITVHHKHK